MKLLQIFLFPQEDVILDILGLAHQYGFVDLETAISDFLRQALSLSNVCAIFDAARLYQLHYLTRVCATFMDNHAPQIITHETFTQLSSVSDYLWSILYRIIALHKSVYSQSNKYNNEIKCLKNQRLKRGKFLQYDYQPIATSGLIIILIECSQGFFAHSVVIW